MAHAEVLEKLCRVCGKSLVTKTAKTKHLCSAHGESLNSVFAVDITHDSSTVHPRYFCNACKLVLHKTRLTEYKNRTVLFAGWCEHTDDGCSLCQHFEAVRKGGRPKKSPHTTGRPRSDGTRYCIQHIRSIAPSAVVSHHTTPAICAAHQVVDQRELTCPTCLDLLQRPVELVECRTVVCSNCCCTWLQHNTNTNCPCCFSDHLRDFSTVRPASPLLLNLLASVCVVCTECGAHM